MNKKYDIKLEFIINFNREYWFIKNKFKDAEQFIGEKRFAYIINQNIPNCYNKNKKIFYKNLKAYIGANKKNINFLIKQSGNNLSKRIKKLEKSFFSQVEDVTQIKWKYVNYKIHLVYSCFWGGDYDINRPNIYITPLLKHGDPVYVIFHELSHLIFWEYIYSKYSLKFIKRNYNLLWKVSEVMVNYPLMKIKIGFKFPLIIPNKLEKFGQSIIKEFKKSNYAKIINDIIKKRTE